MEPELELQDKTMYLSLLKLWKEWKEKHAQVHHKHTHPLANFAMSNSRISRAIALTGFGQTWRARHTSHEQILGI